MKYILFLFILISCKNEGGKTSNTDNQTPQAIVNDNIFKIKLNFTISEDDLFEVYYTSESADEKFTGEKKVRKKVVASESSQIIVFDLPKNLLPFNFRIDLGQNKIQNEVIIHNINLEFNGNSIHIEQNLIKHFFSINNYLTYENGVFTIIEKNGKRDPFIISKAVLIKKMEIEL